MNWQLLLGLALGLTATYLLTIGGAKLTKKDNEPLEQKVGEVLKKIDEVRSESAPAQQQKLDAIEHDFSAWAADFQTNRTSRKLALEQSRLRAQSEAIEKTRVVRNFFSDFLDYFRKSADAYTKQTGRRLAYDLPPLPEDAFAPASGTWEGTVTFTNKLHWRMWQSDRADGAMVIYVAIPEQQDQHLSGDSFFIAARPDKGTWETFVSGPNFSTVAELEVKDVPLSDRATLKKFVQRAFETQILLSAP